MSSKAAISPLMRWALIATLLLTAASFAIRYWREQRAETVAPPPTASLATAPATTSARPAAPENASPLPPSEGLRAPSPPATIDAMAQRRPPEPPPPPPAAPSAPPPPPPPSFRLIGAYSDGGQSYAIFSHGQQVLTVRPGDGLPEDFIVKSLNATRVSIERQSTREIIEMPLGTP